VIATTTGLVIFLLPFQWPAVISKFLQTLGAVTTPLSMLVIGSLMANMEMKKLLYVLKSPHIWLVVLTRLVFIPLIIIPLLYSGIKYEILVTAILVSGMPSGPTTPMFAKKYGGDAYFGSVGVCITTFLALFTLPFLYWLINLILKYR
jgi:predicted permease